MISLSYRTQLVLLLSPFLLGTLFLVAAPAVLTGLLAFAHYDSLSAPTFAEVANFRELSLDPLYAIAIRNSIVFTATAVPLRLLAAFGLALLLSRPFRGANAYRAAVFLPTLMPDVVYTLVWLWILNPLYGPLNFALRTLGLPAPGWLVEPSTALPALVLMSLFQTGEGFVVLLAALRTIPREYYESAMTDGASRFQRLARITLPLMAPWLVLIACRDVILSLGSTFVPALLMVGAGPDYATLFLPLMIYDEVFDGLRFGVASALMWVMYAIMGAAIWIFFRLTRNWLWADAD